MTSTDVTTAPADPADDPTEPDVTEPDVTADHRSWPPSAVAVAILLVIATLTSMLLWRQAAADPTTEIRDAAVTFATQLTTWDATEGLDVTTEALRAMGTGDFLEEVDDVLGGEIQATAEAVGARSVGEVTEVFANEDGVAIVIVQQALTVAGQTDVQEQIARLELELVDGTWKIARVELLNAPVLLEEAGR